MSVPSPTELVGEIARTLRRMLRWSALTYDQMDMLAEHGATPNALAALGLAELADRLVAVGGWSNALEGADRDAQESWRWTPQLFAHRRMADGAELIQRAMRDDPRFVATIVTPATPGRGDAFSDLNGVCQVDDEMSVWAIVAAASRAATKGVCDEAIETPKKRPSDLALIAFAAEIAKVDAREAEGLLPHVARFLTAGGWEVAKWRPAGARWRTMSWKDPA